LKNILVERIRARDLRLSTIAGQSFWNAATLRRFESGMKCKMNELLREKKTKTNPDVRPRCSIKRYKEQVKKTLNLAPFCTDPARKKD